MRRIKIILHILSYPMVFIMAFLYRASNPERSGSYISRLDINWTTKYRELKEQA